MSLFINTLLCLILAYLIAKPKLEFKFDLFRAFISGLLKNLAFNTSKHYFIYFNICHLTIHHTSHPIFIQPIKII